MNITIFKSTNFRNIKHLEEEFSKGINIFFGNNAQGKTNLIEAIYIIGTVKSFRRVDENNLINLEAESAKINAIIAKSDLEKNISFIFHKKNVKNIYVNNKIISRQADYIGNVNVTLFCPEDLLIIKGEASNRRRLIDILLCRIDKIYLADLINYQRVLKQRNNILKEIREGKNSETLEPWNEQFVRFSCKIMQKRHEIIKKMDFLAGFYHDQFNKGEKLSINYDNSISCGEEVNPEAYESALRNNQKKTAAEEIARGFSLLGPHRDDLEIKINSRNTRFFGSQGQQRSAAVSLRLAEAELIHKETKDSPILLLDDIFSELDDMRKKALMKLIKPEQQTFITGTDLAEFKALTQNAKIFSIAEGRLSVY